jgi:hypothetical protein
VFTSERETKYVGCRTTTSCHLVPRYCWSLMRKDKETRFGFGLMTRPKAGINNNESTREQRSLCLAGPPGDRSSEQRELSGHQTVSERLYVDVVIAVHARDETAWLVCRIVHELQQSEMNDRKPMHSMTDSLPSSHVKKSSMQFQVCVVVWHF